MGGIKFKINKEEEINMSYKSDAAFQRTLKGMSYKEQQDAIKRMAKLKEEQRRRYKVEHPREELPKKRSFWGF